MPIVPSYDHFQVGEAAQAAGQLAAPDSPDVAGKQLSALGEGVMKAADGLQAYENHVAEAKTKESDNQVAEKLRIALHDPDTGALNQIGKTSIENRVTYLAELDAVKQQTLQDITDPLHRAMLEPIINHRIEAAKQQLDIHTAQQAKVYADGQTVARIQNASSDMVVNAHDWNNPDTPMGAAFATARSTKIAEINTLLANASPEERDMKKAQAMAETHSAIIHDLISQGDTKGASVYMAGNLPEIEKGAPDKLDDLRKLLKTSDVRDQSLKLSLDNPTVKDANAMYQSGKISAEVHDELVQRIEHNLAKQKEQRGEWEKNVAGQAYDWVLKHPGAPVQDMPPVMYHNLVATGHIGNLASFAKSNGRPETDDAIYLGLRTMAGEEPAKFAQLDLMKSRASLSDSDWRHIIEIQSSINKSDAKVLESERVMTGAVKSLKFDLAAQGIDLTPKEGSKSALETNKFMSELHRSLDVAQTQKGAPLKPDEARKIGLDLLKQGYLQGSGIFWDDKVKKYQMTDAQRGKPFITQKYGDIPENYRIQILRENPKASRDEVERIYQRAMDSGVIK